MRRFGNSVVIKEADLKEPSQARAFLRLLNAYISDEMGGGEPFSGRRAGQLLDGLRWHPAKLILLAWIDRRPVGMSVSFWGYSTFRACPLLNIHDLIVLPEFRRAGIGRMLMLATEDRASAAGCGKFTLEVRRDNRKARRLYRSLGYAECVPPISFWVKFPARS